MRYSVLLLAAWMLTGVARAADGDADVCRMPGAADRRIAACTRLIDDNGLPAETRALALTSRGLAREANGGVKGAMADYGEAIRLDPRSANARLFRSSLFQNAGDHDRAIADLSEAIRIDPSVALFFTRRGVSYDAKHDYERAIADFTESLRLNPGNIDAIWGRGQANAYAGYRARAIADYTEAIRLDPRFSFAYHDRGVAYRMKGDREHAISDFRQDVRLSPGTAGPSRAALESLGVGEPKKEPGALKRGVLDLLK